MGVLDKKGDSPNVTHVSYAFGYGKSIDGSYQED